MASLCRHGINVSFFSSTRWFAHYIINIYFRTFFYLVSRSQIDFFFLFLILSMYYFSFVFLSLSLVSFSTLISFYSFTLCLLLFLFYISILCRLSFHCSVEHIQIHLTHEHAIKYTSLTHTINETFLNSFPSYS